MTVELLTMVVAGTYVAARIFLAIFKKHYESTLELRRMSNNARNQVEAELRAKVAMGLD